MRSFLPPYGDKLKCVYHRDYEDKHRGFRPLTGMVLSITYLWWCRACFRPLTGIVPDCVLTETMDGLFSPPYGDGTHNQRTAYSGIRVFAPLRGWYQNREQNQENQRVFAPLRGWYSGFRR